MTRVLMACALVWLMSAAATRPVAAATATHSHTHIERNGTAQSESRDGAIEGEWSLDSKRGDGVELRLERHWHSGTSNGSWSSTFDLGRGDFEGLSGSQWSASAAPVSFQLRRDAGAFRLEGRLGRGKGSGHFVFVPDAEFRSDLERAGFEDVTAEEMAALAIHEVDRELIRGFQSRAVHPASIDELVRLKVHGVSADYLDGMKSEGAPPMTVDELVRLKVHGVSPEFVGGMKAAGFPGMDVDELVRLKVHGVSTEYVDALRDAGLSNMTADELIRLEIQGVEPSFVGALRDLGYARLTPDELIRLRIHGVDASLVRRAKARYGVVTVDELIRLRQHGTL